MSGEVAMARESTPQKTKHIPLEIDYLVLTSRRIRDSPVASRRWGCITLVETVCECHMSLERTGNIPTKKKKANMVQQYRNHLFIEACYDKRDWLG
jgi:hypothetical protein